MTEALKPCAMQAVTGFIASVGYRRTGRDLWILTQKSRVGKIAEIVVGEKHFLLKIARKVVETFGKADNISRKIYAI